MQQNHSDPDLEFYIETIRAYPEIIARNFWQRTLRADQIETELIGGEPKYVVTEELENSIRTGLERMRLKYTVIADWLRHDLLSEVAPAEDWKAHYQPLAQVYSLQFELCDQMWLQEWQLQKAFHSPAYLWAEGILSTTLVIAKELFQGQNLYEQTRKTQWYKETQASLVKLEALSNCSLSVETHLSNKAALLAEIPNLHPSLLASKLETLAATMACLDAGMEASYSKYLKHLRHLHRAVKNDPLLQLNYFCDDEIFVSQRGRHPSSRRRG